MFIGQEHLMREAIRATQLQSREAIERRSRETHAEGTQQEGTQEGTQEGN